MTGVTKRETPVIIEMINGYECEMLTSFHNLATYLQMEKRDVRNICRSLKRKGLAEHTFAINNRDESKLSGSGYILTKTGYIVAKTLLAQETT